MITKKNLFGSTWSTALNYIFKRYTSINPEVINCTSLVIYGSNLGSTLNYGRFSKVVKNSIFLTSESWSIIVGQLLSDGWMERTSINKTRYRFKQSISRSDYVIWSFFSLSHYCSNLPFIVSSKRKGKINYGLAFSTRTLPCLNEAYDLFYKDRVKLVPDSIFEYLTPIALAHWIMGDGAKLNKGLVLCTDSFSVGDVVKLMNVLKLKFDINTTLQGLNNNQSKPSYLYFKG